jgi:hypothetical protein
VNVGDGVRGRWASARWSVRITARRAANRWWDLLGLAAGFCMTSTWDQTRATYGPGRRHWRCGKLLRNHGSAWHRFGDFRWMDDQPAIMHVVPGSGVGAGQLPRWLRGRHYSVGTRRRDRFAQRVAFERIGASMRAAAAGSVPYRFVTGGPEGPVQVEIGGVPFMGPGIVRLGPGMTVDSKGRVVPQDAESVALDAYRHPEKYRIQAFEVMPDGTRVLVGKSAHRFVGTGEGCRAMVSGPVDQHGGFTSTDERDECGLPRTAHPDSMKGGPQ